MLCFPCRSGQDRGTVGGVGERSLPYSVESNHAALPPLADLQQQHRERKQIFRRGQDTLCRLVRPESLIYPSAAAAYGISLLPLFAGLMSLNDRKELGKKKRKKKTSVQTAATADFCRGSMYNVSRSLKNARRLCLPAKLPRSSRDAAA